MNQALLARQTTETSLRDTFGVIKRRRWLIVLTMVLAMSFGGIVSVITPAAYRSTALLLIEGRASSTAPVSSAQDPMAAYVLANGSFDVLTQIQLIQSFEVLSNAFRDARVVLPPPGSGIAAPSVRVTQLGTTNVLALSVEADDREVAQRLATTIPVVYLGYVRENRDQEVTSALTFLKEKLEAEQKLLSKAEQDLEKFRRARPVVATDQDGMELTARLSRAENAYRVNLATFAQAQNRYNALVNERKNVKDSVETANSSTTFDLIEQQKSLIANLKQRRANLLVDYEPSAPLVKQLDGEIAVQEQRLKDIPKTAVRDGAQRNPIAIDLDTQIARAKAELDGARGALNESRSWQSDARGALSAFMQTQPKESELRRAIETLSVQVAATAKQYSDLAVKKQSVRDPVSVISQASVPQQIAPNIPLILSLFFVIGTVVAVALVSIREYTDDRVLTAQQAGAITQLPVLGHVPTPSRALGQGTGADPMLETYRTLVYNMLFSAAGDPVKSIIVVSSNPREGKSTVAYNIARVIASDSRKVVLVDANLRRPVLHRRLKLQEKPGFTELLKGEVQVSEALQGTEVTGLYVLAAGALTENSSELIASGSLAKVHEALKENADYVIFDTPAVLASADAQVLASVTDASIYVAQLGMSRKGALRYGLDLIRNAHARLLGVVYVNSKGAVETSPYDGLDE